jgi:hypothetical protein
MATDSAAPILNLAGQPYNDFPLIGQQNVPLIGFGIS